MDDSKILNKKLFKMTVFPRLDRISIQRHQWTTFMDWWAFTRTHFGLNCLRRLIMNPFGWKICLRTLTLESNGQTAQRLLKYVTRDRAAPAGPLEPSKPCLTDTAFIQTQRNILDSLLMIWSLVVTPAEWVVMEDFPGLLGAIGYARA